MGFFNSVLGGWLGCKTGREFSLIFDNAEFLCALLYTGLLEGI